jgi:hypothetical protein
MRLLLVLLLAGRGAAPLWGEGFLAPVTGFVLDPASHTIRPFNGTPGAAVLGRGINLPFGIARAASRVHGVVVAISDEAPRRALVIGGLDRGDPAVRVVDGALTDADGLVLSSSGTAALLYTADSMQVLTGLPEQPLAGAVVAVPGRIRAAAISDDGQITLIATDAPGAAGVYRITPVAPSPVLVSAQSGIIGLELLNGGRDAAALDSGARELMLFADVRGAAAPLVLADSTNGLDSPLALSVTRDGRLLLVANRDSKSIVAADPSFQQSPQVTALPAEPGRCDRIGPDDVFLLSETSSRPVYVVDLSAAGTGQVFFVPVE